MIKTFEKTSATRLIRVLGRSGVQLEWEIKRLGKAL